MCVRVCKPVLLCARPGDKESQEESHLRIPLANKKGGVTKKKKEKKKKMEADLCPPFGKRKCIMRALYKSSNRSVTQDAAQIRPGLAAARGSRAQSHGGTQICIYFFILFIFHILHNTLSSVFKASLISAQPHIVWVPGGLSGCGHGGRREEGGQTTDPSAVLQPPETKRQSRGG